MSDHLQNTVLCTKSSTHLNGFVKAFMIVSANLLRFEVRSIKLVEKLLQCVFVVGNLKLAFESSFRHNENVFLVMIS